MSEMSKVVDYIKSEINKLDYINNNMNIVNYWYAIGSKDILEKVLKFIDENTIKPKLDYFENGHGNE